nr:ubiquitin-60S ribosomal protein L40-like [Pelodiscus sinensis]|eukprot:XP_014428716.1 ubiquitin-60S ribosomal protein L40-like [Pelodiscus sinensis]
MEPTRPGKSAATIFVKTLTGETLSVDVYLDETVLDLKRKIEAQEGTPVDQMRLIASNPGRQLNNDWTLRRSGLTDGCVVHLVLRLRGGGDITTTPLLPDSSRGNAADCPRPGEEQDHLQDDKYNEDKCKIKGKGLELEMNTETIIVPLG